MEAGDGDPPAHPRRLPGQCVSANSRWKFEYNRGNGNGEFEHELGTYSPLDVVTFANPQNVKMHKIVPLGELDLSGYKESVVILVRISRLAQSDGADNQAGIVTLVSWDAHYQKDKSGTDTEIPS